MQIEQNHIPSEIFSGMVCDCANVEWHYHNGTTTNTLQNTTGHEGTLTLTLADTLVCVHNNSADP